MIEKDTIQEIFETARIEEVVGEFVTLKKRGANLLGLCPFHNEKTPSFTVSPRRGIYKCFGCGKGGNAVNFLMEHENFTYPEALKYLAKKYNIEVQEEEQTPEQIQELNEKESLFHVNEFAARHFVSNLFGTEQGRSVGLSYFKERGFREDIIKKFQLGYSIDEWDNFTKHALSQGYKIEYLEKTGLTIVRDEKHYDRFRGRVIFPIHNISGRVLGFGGRTLSKEKNIPKYVNSPESDIYHKSEVLYGINHAKSSIIGSDNCYLVEGYTDVISLHQSGIENVVASSGTSLTTGQIRLIRRYTSNITILYDGDEAGLKASFRGIDMILEQGMDVRVVLFPEGEDPDSFARSHRTNEVREYITENARNFILFKTSLLLKEAEGDPIKKAGLIKEIVGSIALIPDTITRSVYVKECAGRLDMAEQTLMNQLNRIRRQHYDNKIKEKSHSRPEEVIAPFTEQPEIQKEVDFLSSEYQEKDVIRLLMNYGNRILEAEKPVEGKKPEKIEFDIASMIVNDLQSDGIAFEDPYCAKVFRATVEQMENGNLPDEQFFLNHPDHDISMLATSMLIPKYELNDWERVKIIVKDETDSLDKTIIKGLLAFKLRKLEKMFQEESDRLKSGEDDQDMDKSINRIRKINKRIHLISGQLGGRWIK
ncbi:MAG: DNA primase [Bacteroidales bacterium]